MTASLQLYVFPEDEVDKIGKIEAFVRRGRSPDLEIALELFEIITW